LHQSDPYCVTKTNRDWSPEERNQWLRWDPNAQPLPNTSPPPSVITVLPGSAPAVSIGINNASNASNGNGNGSGSVSNNSGVSGIGSSLGRVSTIRSPDTPRPHHLGITIPPPPPPPATSSPPPLSPVPTTMHEPSSPPLPDAAPLPNSPSMRSQLGASQSSMNHCSVPQTFILIGLIFEAIQLAALSFFPGGPFIHTPAKYMTDIFGVFLLRMPSNDATSFIYAWWTVLGCAVLSSLFAISIRSLPAYSPINGILFIFSWLGSVFGVCFIATLTSIFLCTDRMEHGLEIQVRSPSHQQSIITSIDSMFVLGDVGIDTITNNTMLVRSTFSNVWFRSYSVISICNNMVMVITNDTTIIRSNRIIFNSWFLHSQISSMVCCCAYCRGYWCYCISL
jgi:hypothetical protein